MEYFLSVLAGHRETGGKSRRWESSGHALTCTEREAAAASEGSGRPWGTEPAQGRGPAAAAFVGTRNHFKTGFSVIKTLDLAVPCIHFLLHGLPG